MEESKEASGVVTPVVIDPFVLSRVTSHLSTGRVFACAVS